jgi:hypothetical protein
MFVVTKTFIDGALAGLTVEDPYCPAPFRVGQVYGGHGFGSRYRVKACRKIR